MHTIKENLEAAIKIIEDVPDDMIDLKNYAHPCGTIFCTAGVLAQHAFFVDQLFLPRDGIRSMAAGIANSALMWGGWPFSRLFSARKELSNSGEVLEPGGNFDDVLLAQRGPMTDKQLALARLHHALKAENAYN